jgi:hypothetical protein
LVTVSVASDEVLVLQASSPGVLDRLAAGSR